MINNEKPLISILIPLYNHERFIFQCLDSIINDPYPSKEIIILNDGSTDNSMEAVQKWQIKNKDKLSGLSFTLKTRGNMGICKTLNELVSMAQGEYVALLASDDFLLPGGIQARADYLREHPDKLAVFADCTVVDNEGNTTHKSGIEDLFRGRKRYILDETLRAYELVFHWCVPGPVFMARREAYQKVGLYDETLLVEDWDYYLRLVSHNALGFVDYAVASYRRHNTNMVKTISKMDLIDWPLDTISKNIGRFTGIKRFALMVVKIRKIGEKHCFNGKFITGITLRALAKLLEYIVYAIYENMVTLQVNYPAHRAGHQKH
jgi:glycosyltransferase involved in cell wall biosynthesis